MIFDWNRCCAVAEVRELSGDSAVTLPGPGLWAGILSSGRCQAEGTGGYDAAGASGDLLLCGGAVTLSPIEDCHLLAVRLTGLAADAFAANLDRPRFADGALCPGAADCVVTENADGTVTYDITMRDDLVFSDGEPVTIDDVIFGIYVYLDPTYDGATTWYSLPIEGVEAYRSGMSTKSSLIAAAGEDNTDFTYWTEEEQTAFWAAVNDGGVKFAQEIVDYCVANGLAADSNDVATAAANWAYEGLAADATAKDFFMAIGNNYNWNFSQMEAETAGSALSDLIPEDVYSMST